MGVVEAIDGEGLGGRVEGEAEEAADLVVLVEGGELVLQFFFGQAELGQGQRAAETAGALAVAIDKFLQGHGGCLLQAS